MASLTNTVFDLTLALAKLAGTEQFIVNGTLALVLTSLICGAVGSLVVGNRMAFFSDALGHCAIAGISLGFLLAHGLHLGGDSNAMIGTFALLVMVSFGALVGVGIAYVREKTSLASDTVIGVFFAGALGLGAVLFGFLKRITNLDPDAFLFGSPSVVQAADLLRLLVLAIVTALFVGIHYNQLVFASFNTSLARSAPHSAAAV